MSHSRIQLDRITEEAALWFVRAQDAEFSRDDHKALASWLAGSAEHVREYLQLAAITADIHVLSATPNVDELVALACASAGESNVVPLSSAVSAVATKQTPSVARRHRPAIWAAAASVVLAVAVGLWLFATSGPVGYSTGIGEQVSFPLEDGSVVTLNAQSSLELDYTESERTVRLMAGEALFDVEKDPDRPFQVLTDRAVIRAVGTSFNVRHRGKGTIVTVVEGIVDVRSLVAENNASGGVAKFPASAIPADGPTPVKFEPIRLTVGQQARVQSGDVVVIDNNVEKVTSWRERRLVFESWALADVVAEFNLYNDQRIVISDVKLAQRAISGAFDADDRESFALFLSEAGLAVFDERADGTIVLRLPHEGQ